MAGVFRKPGGLFGDLSKGPGSRWMCSYCGKRLSSKRSQREHMNTHTNARPFGCSHCSYAAASQMTLRRHILRNHTSREVWGYKCPYCGESYMEPASYQHHIMTKHFGQSGTFGCPETLCEFQTLCAKHFKEHMKKHELKKLQYDSVHQQQATDGSNGIPGSKTSQNEYSNGYSSNMGSHIPEPIGIDEEVWEEFESRMQDLTAFLVDDELGNGFGKAPIPPPPKFVPKMNSRAGTSTFLPEKRASFLSDHGSAAKPPSLYQHFPNNRIPSTISSFNNSQGVKRISTGKLQAISTVGGVTKLQLIPASNANRRFLIRQPEPQWRKRKILYPPSSQTVSSQTIGATRPPPRIVSTVPSSSKPTVTYSSSKSTVIPETVPASDTLPPTLDRCPSNIDIDDNTIELLTNNGSNDLGSDIIVVDSLAQEIEVSENTEVGTDGLATKTIDGQVDFDLD